MKQRAVAQTALVKLAVSSLFNYVLCKVFPHEFGLLIRKFSPTGLDGLPSTVECGNQGLNGVRIKYAALCVIVEKLEHLFRSPFGARRYCPYFRELASVWRFSECFAGKRQTGTRHYCTRPAFGSCAAATSGRPR